MLSLSVSLSSVLLLAVANKVEHYGAEHTTQQLTKDCNNEYKERQILQRQHEKHSLRFWGFCFLARHAIVEDL